MSAVTPQAYRLLAATGLHKGDRPYQQDQVQILRHDRAKDCLLAVLADGMGGKSGGRKAADQVVHTARQLFDRFVPGKDAADEFLRQLVLESHLMIKLTAITAEEEPHSTLAAFLLGPGLGCDVVHAGDSRVYHFRGAEMLSRTLDNSYVHNLIHGFILAAEHLVPGGSTPGQAYFINDGEPLNMFEFARPVVEACGRKLPNFRVSGKLVHKAMMAWQWLHFKYGIREPLVEPLAVERLYLNNYFSIAKARRDLGYEPLYTTEAAMAECLPYYTELFRQMESQGSEPVVAAAAPVPPNG